MAPLVSIAIPFYCSEKYISETLRSVSNQDYSNLELIFVDDGSLDNSLEIVKQWINNNPHIKSKLIINEVNLGPSKATEIALREATGQYFQKLDSDDIICKDKISNQVALFKKLGEEYAVIYATPRLIDHNSHLINMSYAERIETEKTPSGDVYKTLIYSNFIPQSTTLVKLKAIHEVGGYDKELLYMEDWDLWIRLSVKYKIYFQDTINSSYRIHSQSIMHNKKNEIDRNESCIRIFKKLLSGTSISKDEILKKLCEYSIYSYVLCAKSANKNLKFCLTKKFNLKILIYFLLTIFGIQKPRFYSS